MARMTPNTMATSALVKKGEVEFEELSVERDLDYRKLPPQIEAAVATCLL